MEANRTVVIPLKVSEESRSDFHQTILPYAYCQQEAADHCWPDTPKQPADLQTSKQDAENALYDQLREDTNEQLHSNLVQKAIKDATSAITSCKTSWENGDRISKPDFYDRDKAGYTMTYDKRAATYNRYEATFSTLNGTVTCRYELPAEVEGTPYGEYVLDRRWSFSTSKLVFDSERFWLHAVMQRQFRDDPVYAPQTNDASSDTPEDTHRVLGVDLNVDGATAVTSTGQFYGNADALNATGLSKNNSAANSSRQGREMLISGSNSVVAQSGDTTTSTPTTSPIQSSTKHSGFVPPTSRSRT